MGTQNAAVEKQEINQNFWKKLEEDWNELAATNEHEWLSEFSDSARPFEKYAFREENPLLGHANALEEGKLRLAEGDIPSAVLLFEAAVQEDTQSAEAWALLGTTQAKNEQDPMAIAALRQALGLDGSNETALMALAVSYTNESYQGLACQTLQGKERQLNSYS